MKKLRNEGVVQHAHIVTYAGRKNIHIDLSSCFSKLWLESLLLLNEQKTTILEIVSSS